jgi:hypothetical protein
MRTLGAFSIALLLTTGLLAQHRGSVSPRPVVTGGFGSVVFPGGTPATTPGVTRNFGSVVNPGGGGPRTTIPGVMTGPTSGPRSGRPGAGQNFSRLPASRVTHRTGAVPYAYPVYVGGYYDTPYPAVEPAPAPQQPNVTVIYPPQQATPTIIYVGSRDGQLTTTTERQPAEEPAATAEAPHYLIAFKDHSICSAVAYWVDGDTLHYFTSGNTHNQASVSLVDRDLTERLNEGSGVEVKLPAAK